MNSRKFFASLELYTQDLWRKIFSKCQTNPRRKSPGTRLTKGQCSSLISLTPPLNLLPQRSPNKVLKLILIVPTMKPPHADTRKISLLLQLIYYRPFIVMATSNPPCSCLFFRGRRGPSATQNRLNYPEKCQSIQNIDKPKAACFQ